MKKKRFVSLLLCLCMVLALLPGTALAESTYQYQMHATVTEPVEGQKPSTVVTDSGNQKAESNPKITPPIVIANVEWSGELDANGCFKAGVAYTVTITEQINPECSSRFIFKSAASVNGKKANVISLSEDARTLIASYTFPTLKNAAQIAQDEADKAAADQAKQDAKDQKEHEAELERRWSQAEADANYPLGDPLTLVVNEDTVNMETVEELLDFLYSHGTLGTDVYTELLHSRTSYYHTLDGRTDDQILRLPRAQGRGGRLGPVPQVPGHPGDL